MKLSRVAAGLLPALLALAPVIAFNGAAHAGEQEVETKFTRWVEKGSKAKLDVAYATYSHPESKVEIVLYGVIHLADKAYYKAVQKDLDSYDAVLFEGVGGPKDMANPPKPDENMATIGELQGLMGKLLGLTFQKDGIDYKGAKNFVHADMTVEELMKATDGDLSKALPGGGMLNDPNVMKQLKPMMKMLKGMGGNLPGGMRDMLKMQMGKQLANVDMSALPGGEGVTKILVGARNEVAMKVLDSELAKRKQGSIAIFYGAAHMKDFHERLAKMGWSQKKVQWHTAWDIGGKKAADEDEDEQPADKDEDEKPAPKRQPTPSGGKRRWL